MKKILLGPAVLLAALLMVIGVVICLILMQPYNFLQRAIGE